MYILFNMYNVIKLFKKNTYLVIFKKKVARPKFMSVVLQQWM